VVVRGAVGLGVVVRGAVGLGVVVGVVLGRVGLGRGVRVLGVLGGVVLRSSSSQGHAAGERSMEFSGAAASEDARAAVVGAGASRLRQVDLRLQG